MPEPRFFAAVAAFEGLGQRTAKSISAEDVAPQAIEVEARLKTLQAEEVTLRDLLRRAGRLSDVMTVRDRLTQVRTEIERLLGQRRLLASRTAYADLSLTLTQLPSQPAAAMDSAWFTVAWGQATGAVGELTRGLIVAALWLAAFSPYWLTGLVVMWSFTRWSARGRRPVPPQ